MVTDDKSIRKEGPMFRLVRQDLKQFSHGPHFRDKIKVFFLSSGFFCVVLVRLQNLLYNHHLLLLAYAVHHANLILTGADILPGCQIGGGLHVEHPVGIVIGAGVIIGSNCTILQGVTIGAKYVDRTNGDNKFPVIGDNVSIGAKASIIGGIIVGSNSTVGAHALVRKSAPRNSRLVGIPAHEIGLRDDD
jgi:serine O-acetyltransferase